MLVGEFLEDLVLQVRAGDDDQDVQQRVQRGAGPGRGQIGVVVLVLGEQEFQAQESPYLLGQRLFKGDPVCSFSHVRK